MHYLVNAIVEKLQLELRTAGGVSIDSEQGAIQVITPTAPLGQALMGKRVDDEVD